MYEKLRSYIDTFNKNDDELYIQLISNKEAEQFLAEQIPLIDCPDKEIEEIYYFRVENLWLDGQKYRIVYDKDGTHYGLGTGLSVQKC